MIRLPAKNQWIRPQSWLSLQGQLWEHDMQGNILLSSPPFSDNVWTHWVSLNPEYNDQCYTAVVQGVSVYHCPVVSSCWSVCWPIVSRDNNQLIISRCRLCHQHVRGEFLLWLQEEDSLHEFDRQEHHHCWLYLVLMSLGLCCLTLVVWTVIVTASPLPLEDQGEKIFLIKMILIHDLNNQV